MNAAEARQVNCPPDRDLESLPAVKEARLCAEYAEACRWWAELQESPPMGDVHISSWLTLVHYAYEKVERLARRTGLPNLSFHVDLDANWPGATPPATPLRAVRK
jgi:hypothetical protein